MSNPTPQQRARANEILDRVVKTDVIDSWQKFLTAFRILAIAEPDITNAVVKAMLEFATLEKEVEYSFDDMKLFAYKYAVWALTKGQRWLNAMSKDFAIDISPMDKFIEEENPLSTPSEAELKNYLCVCKNKKLPPGVMCRCIHIKEIGSDESEPPAPAGEWKDLVSYADSLNQNEFWYGEQVGQMIKNAALPLAKKLQELREEKQRLSNQFDVYKSHSEQVVEQLKEERDEYHRNYRNACDIGSKHVQTIIELQSQLSSQAGAVDAVSQRKSFEKMWHDMYREIEENMDQFDREKKIKAAKAMEELRMFIITA